MLYNSTIDGSSSVAERAQAKLGRDLTERELNAILNAGSLNMLHPVTEYIRSIKNPNAIESMLTRLAESFEGHLKSARALAIEQISIMIGREIDDEECAALERITLIGDVMDITDRINEATPPAREATFQQVIAELTLGG
jgi:hypothetical protein